MGINAGFGAVLADDCEEFGDVIAQPFRGDGGVFDERHRLGIALFEPSTGPAPISAASRCGLELSRRLQSTSANRSRGRAYRLPTLAAAPARSSPDNSTMRIAPGSPTRKSRNRAASAFRLVLSRTYLSMTSTADGPCARMIGVAPRASSRSGNWITSTALGARQFHEMKFRFERDGEGAFGTDKESMQAHGLRPVG